MSCDLQSHHFLNWKIHVGSPLMSRCRLSQTMGTVLVNEERTGGRSEAGKWMKKVVQNLGKSKVYSRRALCMATGHLLKRHGAKCTS